MNIRPRLAAFLSLATGAGLQMAANVGVGLLSTLLLPIAERGIMVVILTVASLTAVLGTVGIGNAYRSAHPNSDDPAELTAAYSRLALALVLVSGVVGALAVLVLGRFDVAPSMWVAIVSATAVSTISQTASVIVTDARFALGEFHQGAHWAATAAVSGLLVATVVMIWQQSAVATVAAQAAGQIIVILFAAVAAVRSGALTVKRSSRRSVRPLMVAGARSLVLPISLLVMTRVDRLVVAFVSVEAVAVYALAATIVEVVRLIPNSVGQTVARDVAVGAGWRALRKQLAYGIGATGLLLILIVGLAAVGITPIFGAEYASAVGLTVVLGLSEIAFGLLAICTLAVLGGGWSKMNIVAGVIGSTLAIAGYPLACLMGQEWGVAYSRVILVGLVALCLFFFVGRRTRDRHVKDN